MMPGWPVRRGTPGPHEGSEPDRRFNGQAARLAHVFPFGPIAIPGVTAHDNVISHEGARNAGRTSLGGGCDFRAWYLSRHFMIAKGLPPLLRYKSLRDHGKAVRTRPAHRL